MTIDAGPADVKPKVEASEVISLKVQEASGDAPIVFKVKRSTKFEKIINAYCAKKGKRPEEIRFVFNGQRIRGDQTPDHLDMEDGECIDAHLEQIGGADQGPAAGGETVRPKSEGAEVISIKVRDQHQGEVVFKVKRTTKFARIMNAFCERKAWDPKQVRFVFEGQRISAESTPEDHDMEEGDCLDAVLEQIGGWQ